MTRHRRGTGESAVEGRRGQRRRFEGEEYSGNYHNLIPDGLTGVKIELKE